MKGKEPVVGKAIGCLGSTRWCCSAGRLLAAAGVTGGGTHSAAGVAGGGTHSLVGPAGQVEQGPAADGGTHAGLAEKYEHLL